MLSIAKTELESKLISKIESLLEPMGFRIVDLDVRVSHRSLVRIFIDKIEAGSSVTLDHCAQVSRALENALDSDFNGSYEMEVSSPGLDRRLRLKSDFERAQGQQVKLRLKEVIETGGKNLTGTLLGTEDGTIQIEWNRKPVKVAIANIIQANINN